MLLFIVIPALALIGLIVLAVKLPKMRRRARLERTNTPHCPACLRDCTDLDPRSTEFCPDCRRRLPRFTDRRGPARLGEPMQ